MTVLVLELSNLVLILSDRNLEVMLAELIIREKNLQNFAAVTLLVPELLLFIVRGSVPCSSVVSVLIYMSVVF